MRLNHALPPDGNTGADLDVTPADKRAAARYLERELGPAAVRKGAQAITASSALFGTSNTARGALRGWDTRKGLDFCQERWEEAWQNVCNHFHREINALGGTAKLFEGEEHRKVHDFTSIARSEGKSRVNDL
ncbi:hypothetical protein GCM10009801_81600 [Streptomyces albiaxialis]|uniref:Uncharacterized protein n=2 Tax=Streptomyces albiaxialis TaxID=329523 RepID=A0ABN2X602_9ACTN